MAIVNLNPPVYLLFDYLLASSWAWLALCLATIATTLRALRLHFLRRRLLHTLASLEPSAPPSPSPAAVTPPLSPFPRPLPCALNPPAPPQPSSEPRASRSKSTSSLENLLPANRDGFWVPGVNFLSSIFDSKLSSNLKKIASASKIFHGMHESAETLQRPEFHAEHGSSGEGIGSEKHDRAPGCRVGLRFRSEAPAKLDDEPLRRSLTEDGACADEQASSPWWLPSWALSMCGPSQLWWPSTYHGAHLEVSPYLVSPCFEKQFGWDKLLESKFGFSWRIPFGAPQQSGCAMESHNVVKMWDGPPKKMLTKLDLDEQSTLALDACVPEGLACTGNVAGEVSLWELERRACARASATFVKPVLALSMNLERRATIVGSAASISLWDQRSPSRSLQCTSLQLPSITGVKSSGNGLCVANGDGIMSLYDLRKLYGGHVVAGMAPKLHPNGLMFEDESELWEDLPGDTEDEFDDDCGISSQIQAVQPQKGDSLMSRLVTFVRAVTFKS